MKHLFARYTGLAVILAATLWSACTKSTPFGSELLDNDQPAYDLTDTVTVNITVLREDSLRTSDRASTGNLFLCGEVNDPVFGKTTADLYTLFRLVNPATFLRQTDVIDSVWMYLRYRPGGVYGDTLQPQTLRVFRVDPGHELTWNKVYYAADELPATEEIGVLENFLPDPNKADTLFVSGNKAPYVGFKLKPSFHDVLLSFDSATQTRDTLLYKALRGLKITSSAGAAPGAMLAFDLNDPGYSFIRVHYTRDTVKGFIDFEFDGGNKFTHFGHDYAGSPAGQRLDQVNPDLLFVQGANGLRLKVEFPHLASLPRDIVINKAQLELTVADVPGDNPLLFPLPNQLIVNEKRDTVFGPVADVLYSFSIGPTGTTDFSFFGGQPEKTLDNGMTVNRYLLTLSDYFQDALNEPTRNTLYVSVFPQVSTVRRAVFYGPGSTTFPARLTLKYTKIQ